MNDTIVPLAQLAAIRREFPGAEKWIYFETSARGLMPAGARDAVARYLDDRILEGGTKATMLDVLERVRGKFARLIGAKADAAARAAAFAALARINTLYMIAGAWSGHIGTSFSSIEIMSWLFLNELRDLYSAETQLLEALPKMAQAANSSQLRACHALSWKKALSIRVRKASQ